MSSPLKIVVAGKHPLTIREDHPDVRGFFVPGHPRREAERAEYSYSRVMDWLYHNKSFPINSVAEPFAGVGMETLIIEGVFKPDFHVLNDISPVAVDHLRETFPTKTVMLGDAWELMPYLDSYDLFGMDRYSWTARTILDHDHDLVFGKGHKAIVITDVSPFCYHIENNRKAYARGVLPLVGDTHEEYTRNLSEYAYNRWGYSIARTSAWSYCCHHLFLPGRHAVVYTHLPAKAKRENPGVEVLDEE